MNIQAFDIETMRNGSMVDKLPEPELKLGNVKDPEKIAIKKIEAKAKQIEKMALNPLHGRVCAAVFFNDNGALRNVITADTNEAETLLIEWIMETLAGVKLTTYNGISFDMPFVYKRAMLLGIDINCFGAPKLKAWTKKYDNERHIDLMPIWTGSPNLFEKLDNIARAIFGEGKIEIDFKTFPELIKTEAGRIQLLDYCEQDTALTWRIYLRFLGTLI